MPFQIDTDLDRDLIHGAINAFANRSVPLVYCVGYLSSKIVAAANIGSWVVKLKQGDDNDGDLRVRTVFPRRWRDINGEVIVKIWRAGLKAVLSNVMSRPGIPEVSQINQIRAYILS